MWERNKIPLSIILGAVIIGLFIYLPKPINKEVSQQISTPQITATTTQVTPTQLPSPVPPTVGTSPTALPTTNDSLLIKQALITKTGISEDKIEFSINQNTGTHAKGNVKDKESIGGGYWLASKVDGQWIIVYDGQSTPSCSVINPYNFPKSMVSECLNASGTVVVR